MSLGQSYNRFPGTEVMNWWETRPLRVQGVSEQLSKTGIFLRERDNDVRYGSG
jgi:hypothetical protein